MEDSVKTYGLHGVPSCSEAWEMQTAAWCDVRTFPSAEGAIDLCYLANGFGIVTDGHTRRIVCGGNMWCCSSEGKRTETMIVSGNSRLYGLRLWAPQPNEGWCGLSYEHACRIWKLMQTCVRARPMPALELEDSWQELLAHLKSFNGNGEAAMVYMAFGGLVSRCMETMRRPSEGPRILKSSESALAYLETCAICKFPTIETLASRIGYCSGHVMAGFRAAFGVTLKKCMDMIRCEYATRLIMAGEPAQAVAAASGFNGLVAFRKAFARQFGMGISDYRAMCKMGGKRTVKAK